ncbi:MULTISPECIES: histidine phosphatase family protein [Rhodobacterales]|jgi:probable phosphoglycerate mutase|uniref:histidine phosphatase family protein n=1 Tax=Rhodobacterales TaxID=204455 RepID=UPI00237FAFCE|nr:histidine phosphatase family protein [Phaeobacter gallaeciensis]MDE4141131.1 histidine phosphatase family protein [Phaeobacter gallaeciensis]MDE4149576.1 histidine phosphatase family protein [Phaeobacter gallaeciensis]MDE4153974.1 histidine phosphatase family protein [Phaeobacter gallaeciensis]MDE4190228.1 histidine phosphatase family protein [Phaeobacter gallaeciensis]MDE4198279.1 histidine phosphatase family protein [Phaeobacter gallaeciensis]
MIRLALLRHGHTDWNRAGRIQGRSDIALDDTARSELAAQALPAPWDAADLWSSPLLRAAETAKLVAGRDPQTAPELIEMDWGDWEGLRGIDLKADPKSGFRDIEHWGWDYRPPGGETPAEVWERIAPWLQRLTRDTVAVCHIGIMRMILARAYGWDFDGPAPFRIKRNRLFVVEIDGDALRPQPDPIRLIPKEPQ